MEQEETFDTMHEAETPAILQPEDFGSTSEQRLCFY
jgi:hypothetical protein